MIFIDSNVILRFILNDDPKLSPKAAKIFRKIEKEKTTVFLSEVIVAEIVYVLLKVYKLKRKDIKEKLLKIFTLGNISIEDKVILPFAFEIFVSKNVDFEDAYQVALMQKKKVKQIYSFDSDFDKFPKIIRLEN